MEPPVRRHDGGAPVRLRGREPDARAAARQTHGSGREGKGNRGQRPRRDAWRESEAVRPHHEHAHKDKETSDRWRKFKDVADSRHLANRVEPEVVEALVAA